MPSNGLEFYYVLGKQGHRNSLELMSERRQIIGCPTLYFGMIFIFYQYFFWRGTDENNSYKYLARQMKIGLRVLSSVGYKKECELPQRVSINL